MTVKRTANILASLTIAATVSGAVALANGPTWAWLGFGLVTYLMVLPNRSGAKPGTQNAVSVFNPPPRMSDEEIKQLKERLKAAAQGLARMTATLFLTESKRQL